MYQVSRHIFTYRWSSLLGGARQEIEMMLLPSAGRRKKRCARLIDLGIVILVDAIVEGLKAARRLGIPRSPKQRHG